MSLSRSRSLGIFAICAFAILAACSSQVLGGAGQGIDVLTQVQKAPSNTAHEGVRRVDSFYNLDGKSDAVSFRELITTDGKGNFSTRPLEVISGATVPNDEFLYLQKAREGFNWRYRDFLVRDLASFLENYKLKSWGKSIVVAGRTCLELDILRKDGSSHWVVGMDFTTGLVLSYREYDGEEHLTSKMVYESVDFAPSLTGVTFHKLGNAELALQGAPNPEVLLGFTPLTPKLLPNSGFHFLAAYRIQDPNGKVWAKMEYTDGVQTVLFLDSGFEVSPKSIATGGSLSSPHAAELPEKLQMYRVGPVTVLQGDILGHGVIAVGKVPQLDLQILVESALP
mgnify:CR=1 FL=1